MGELTHFERFVCIYKHYVNKSPKKGEIVNYLRKEFSIARATASLWQKRNYIPDDTVRYKISEMFSLSIDIWSDDTWEDMINFELHVADYRLIVADKKNKEKLDEIVYEKHINKYQENHPQQLYEQIKLFKKQEKIDESLKILEILLSQKNHYVYTRYNEILLLKAILLSHNKKKAFDEALGILHLLYSAMEYHLKEPEVLTLLGSNYKRKAFYNTQGKLYELGKIKRKYLIKSLQNYEQALSIRTQERYYDAINIAYLRKILFNATKESIYELSLKEVNWKPKENSWWEMITKAEFFMLMGDLDNAKLHANIYLDKNPVSAHDIGATFRQIKLFLNAVPDDAVAKAFYNYLDIYWKTAS